MSQSRLSSFFGTKRAFFDDNSDSDNRPSKRATTDSVELDIPSSPERTVTPSETPSKTPTKLRTWGQHWNTSFPWLEKEVTEGVTRAVCKWCKNGGKKNAFAIGTTNLQKSAFTRHEKNPETC